MIEINLLPPQYRSVERTPLPVFVGLILGVVLIAGAVFVMVRTAGVTQDLKNQKQEQEGLLAKAQQEEQDFDKLVKSIEDAKGRINTVLSIAESKIPWALKLEQLVETIQNHQTRASETYFEPRYGPKRVAGSAGTKIIY